MTNTNIEVHCLITFVAGELISFQIFIKIINKFSFYFIDIIFLISIRHNECLMSGVNPNVTCEQFNYIENKLNLIYLQ